MNLDAIIEKEIIEIFGQTEGTIMVNKFDYQYYEDHHKEAMADYKNGKHSEYHTKRIKAKSEHFDAIIGKIKHYTHGKLIEDYNLIRGSLTSHSAIYLRGANRYVFKPTDEGLVYIQGFNVDDNTMFKRFDE